MTLSETEEPNLELQLAKLSGATLGTVIWVYCCAWPRVRVKANEYILYTPSLALI